MATPEHPTRPANEISPPSPLPRVPMGRIPVIVRLFDEHGAAWLVPGFANRWTAEAVLVEIPAPGGIRPHTLSWLAASDVRRSVRLASGTPEHTGPAATAGGRPTRTARPPGGDPSPAAAS